MSPAVAGFEVLRFEALPAGSGAAIVELDGRFTGLAPERPRLLLERFGRATELPAVDVSGDPWSATFAVPLEALADAGTAYALVPGRGPLIALPTPSVAVGGDDRFVRLARTVNDLRHRLSDASGKVHDAERRAAAAIAERDLLAREVEEIRARMTRDLGEAREQMARELDDVRGRLADAERRAGDAEQAAEAARAEREAASAAAAESAAATESAVAESDALRQALEDAEIDARAARRELRDTRARLEALQREHGHRSHRPRRIADPAARDGEPHEEPAVADTVEDGTGEHAHAHAGEPLRWDAPEQSGPEAAAQGEPTRTLELPAESLGTVPPEDETGESVRVIRPTPRSAAARRHPIARHAEPQGEAGHTGETDEHDSVVGPGVVGARLIEPSTTRPSPWTQARIIVAVAAGLLFLALVAIFLGFGIL